MKSLFQGSFIIGTEGCRVTETYYLRVRKKLRAVFFKQKSPGALVKMDIVIKVGHEILYF